MTLGAIHSLEVQASLRLAVCVGGASAGVVSLRGDAERQRKKAEVKSPRASKSRFSRHNHPSLI